MWWGWKVAEDWNVNAMAMCNCWGALGDDLRREIWIWGFFVGGETELSFRDIWDENGGRWSMAVFRMCMWDQEVEMTAAGGG